jgi:hypothetical protein
MVKNHHNVLVLKVLNSHQFLSNQNTLNKK